MVFRVRVLRRVIEKEIGANMERFYDLGKFGRNHVRYDPVKLSVRFFLLYQSNMSG